MTWRERQTMGRSEETLETAGQEPGCGRGDLVDALETPVVTVDLDIMEANLFRLQSYCDEHDLALRPHVKTHKVPALARRQVDLGAIGIACQKLGEAEVMAAAGIGDILIPYNLVGRSKLERLGALAGKARITVAMDSVDVLRPMAESLAGAGQRIGAIVELESELKRCGVSGAGEAVQLAREIARSGVLEFRGLMVYPSSELSMPLVRETVVALRAEGLSTEIVSGGGTPTAYRSHEFPELTEIRVGIYAFNDWMTVKRGACRLEDCALRVVVTVVSTPVPGRVIVDGGSKTFALDGGFPMGYIYEYPEAKIYALSEEHGFVDVEGCPRRPKIGERLTVVPYHVCAVVNLYDWIIGLRKGRVEEVWRVAARGKVQ
jgi:D-serine deaminase-like pyridoxal phosphate-dependent protein